MQQFEGYDRRINTITPVLTKYGFKDLDEAKALCTSRGIDVEKLVKDGTISKEQAVHHPKKNMLTKALGCTSFVEPDVSVKGFLRDDILLMASDGLTNMVKQEDIFKIVKGNIEKAPIRLVDLANENGGLDNITVVVMKNI